MPRSGLNHPPPAKPAMDNLARNVQTFIDAMKLNMKAAEEGKPWPFPDSYRPGFAVRKPITLGTAPANQD